MKKRIHRKNISVLKAITKKKYAILMRESWFYPDRLTYTYCTEYLDVFRLNTNNPKATTHDMNGIDKCWFTVNKVKTSKGYKYNTTYTKEGVFELIEALGNHKAFFQYIEKLYDMTGGEILTGTGGFVTTHPLVKPKVTL